MSLFNDEFFPTPVPLVHTMIQGIDFSDKYILEPSAGKGDILDVIKRKFREGYYRTPNYRVIEIEPELCAILASKGYTVVANDFLSYVPSLSYNYIIGNPPFAEAEEHLFKAWEILTDGELIFVMPKSSLDGKTAKEQLLLRMIEDYGSYEDVGQPFRNAERPTDVECVVVRLTKHSGGVKMGFDVHNDRVDPEFKEDDRGSEVAVTGFVNDLLSHFDAAVANYAAYSEARTRIERYIEPIREFYDGNKTWNVMKESDELTKPNERYNRFVDLAQQAAWVKILDNPQFQSMLTKQARTAMAEFRQRQRHVDFNPANIRAMFAEIYLQKDALLDAAIQDAFNNMTKYHEYNRVHVEGWKSNEAYMATRRLVMPNYVRYGGGYSGFSINYSYRDELNDIDRAMCVVAKMRFESIKRGFDQ